MLKKLAISGIVSNARAYSTKLCRYIEEIPNGSTVMIGGYLNQQVPNELIKMLGQADCYELTLVTNASIGDSIEAKSLFQTHGKIKRLVTCLEKNRGVLFDKDIKYPFQLDFMRTGQFVDQVSKRRGDYALIRSPLTDPAHNLLWQRHQSDYFNRAFATLASCYAIAQVEQLIHPGSNEAYNQLDRIFVKEITFGSDNNKTWSVDKTDMNKWEVIVKRLLLELQNEDNVYFTNKVNSLIQAFYEPKHIHLNRLNSNLSTSWPSNYAEFLNYTNKMSLCVVKAQGVDKNGHIRLDSSQIEDCLVFDMIDKSTCRLIAVMEFEDLKRIESYDGIGRSLVPKRRPDMIITNKGVFRINKPSDCLELVEYYGSDVTQFNSTFDFTGFRPLVNRDSLKLMAQECF